MDARSLTIAPWRMSSSPSSSDMLQRRWVSTCTSPPLEGSRDIAACCRHSLVLSLMDNPESPAIPVGALSGIAAMCHHSLWVLALTVIPESPVVGRWAAGLQRSHKLVMTGSRVSLVLHPPRVVGSPFTAPAPEKAHVQSTNHERPDEPNWTVDHNCGVSCHRLFSVPTTSTWSVTRSTR